MTPQQAKGRASVVDALGDIRTQIAALVVAVQAAGMVVTTPAERRLEEANSALDRKVTALQQEVEADRQRLNALETIVQSVRRLEKAKCAETRDRLARSLLDCD